MRISQHIYQLANEKNIDWPKIVVGILPTILVFAGYGPQFYEIYRIKLVRGISLIFLVIDILGAAFSATSLVFSPPPFDILAASVYLIVVMLNSVIIILYYILNWIHRKNSNEYNDDKSNDHINIPSNNLSNNPSNNPSNEIITEIIIEDKTDKH
ncbi:2256_t:CDS:2 [Cetraspora pellucida]|uniref:2256_t:CDS:1 n=1 Tax=Cetraspora pellucida TaxID=1433469 RepID=A0A9N9JHR5_9GLOM|nr:2256_t:CDS:2 [Cetraspora pellucida]